MRGIIYEDKKKPLIFSKEFDDAIKEVKKKDYSEVEKELDRLTKKTLEEYKNRKDNINE
jgi:hypothetical protein